MTESRSGPSRPAWRLQGNHHLTIQTWEFEGHEADVETSFHSLCTVQVTTRLPVL